MPSGPHADVPVRHSSLGLHALPETQPQWPLASHVPPEQGVPAALGSPATHDATPAVHVVVPTWQTSTGVHAAPALQTTHTPAPSHVPFGHGVPAALEPVTAQTAAPDAQSVEPVVHGSPVPHAVPGTHAPASPTLVASGPTSTAPESIAPASCLPESTAEASLAPESSRASGAPPSLPRPALPGSAQPSADTVRPRHATKRRAEARLDDIVRP